MSRNRGPLDGGIPDYETPDTDANDVADYLIGEGAGKHRASKPKPSRSSKRVRVIRPKLKTRKSTKRK